VSIADVIAQLFSIPSGSQSKSENIIVRLVKRKNQLFYL